MLNTNKFNSRFIASLALTVSLLWSSYVAAQSTAIPMPKIPSSAPENSVPMGSAAEFSEVALDFPIAAGPFQPTWDSIEENYPGTPE